MKWYGSVTNRIEENRQYVPSIEVGTGVTEYLYTDRHPYEVTKVIDQKHVYIRPMGYKCVGGAYSNDWELYSLPDDPEIYLTKRGKYWYETTTLTPDEARDLVKKYKAGEHGAYLRCCMAGFDVENIALSGKKKTLYKRMSVSFGKAEYYYCYEL